MKEHRVNGWHEVYGVTGEELQNAARMTEEKYGDILLAQRPYDPARKRASASARAAQFSPFAALTGFEAEIEEEGRRTDERIELSETQKNAINEVLLEAEQKLAAHPVLRAVYFQPDEKKDGGAYVSHTGPVKQIDRVYGLLVFDDRFRVKINDLCDLISVSEEPAGS
ncbi:MAG: hypothetical protein IKS32_03100 [Solobacterium sp.]|nr:hypothetical protein [Solobacterium sp.]